MPSDSVAITSRATGFSIIGDNVDKNVKPRYMRSSGYRVKSLHYFHAFALQDRVDCDTTNRLKELTCLPDDRVIAATLLPSTEDDRIMRKNLTMLVTRVLSKYFSYFEKSFSDVVVWHLKHQRYEEMSKKNLLL